MYVCVSLVYAVCLGLIWDSDQPPVDDIMAVVNNIGLTLQLSDVSEHYITFSFDDPFQFSQCIGLNSLLPVPFPVFEIKDWVYGQNYHIYASRMQAIKYSVVTTLTFIRFSGKGRHLLHCNTLRKVPEFEFSCAK